MSENSASNSVGRLASLLSNAVGEPVEIDELTPLSGGAASMSYFVDARRGDAPWPLILQQSANETGSRRMTRAVQAAVQQRAGENGVPVPEIVYVLAPQDGLGEGFVMSFVPGESLAPRYLRRDQFGGAREALTRQTAEALAKLHSIRATAFDGLDLPVLDAPAQLRMLRDSYDEMGGAVPVFEMAFVRLERRLKPCSTPVLVHGDFRSGNFIVGEEGLRSVLDWELAHLGDPLLDIGWLCTNTWRFGNWRKPVGGFGEREEFYRAYEAAGGKPVDREQAAAMEMLGSLRWGVMCLQMAAGHLEGDAVSVERAAIGRRVSETEADLVYIMKEGRV